MPVEQFLNEHPELSQAVLGKRRAPMAAAGMMAELCLRLRERMQATGIHVRTTTGADTAWTRRKNGIEKTHANDAACCGATQPITQLRKPTMMKATGHALSANMPETLAPRGISVGRGGENR